MHNSKRAIVSAQLSPKCTIGDAQLNRGKYPLRPSDYIPSLQYWLPLIAREWVTNCSYPWYFAIQGKQIQPNTVSYISSLGTLMLILIFYSQHIRKNNMCCIRKTNTDRSEKPIGDWTWIFFYNLL